MKAQSKRTGFEEKNVQLNIKIPLHYSKDLNTEKQYLS